MNGKAVRNMLRLAVTPIHQAWSQGAEHISVRNMLRLAVTVMAILFECSFARQLSASEPPDTTVLAETPDTTALAETSPLPRCPGAFIGQLKGYGTAASPKGMAPGIPGQCGCDPLPQDYPDYTIRYDVPVSNPDADANEEDAIEWKSETRTVQHGVLETSHFTIRYPASTSRSKPDGSSGGTRHTDCRWDWGISTIEDFGEDGFLIDCSSEESFANALSPLLERIWAIELEMGYPAPETPSGKIDVYVGVLSMLLGASYDAAAEACAKDSSGGPTHSRLFVNSAGGGGTQLEAALAHELFHVVQNGIDHKESLAWSESTALWMQSVVTGSVDWAYESVGIDSYDKPLTDVQPWDLRYGNVVWPQFLAAHYGEEIILDIWMDANSAPGDEGMLHAYKVLNQEMDGYTAAIHQLRYSLWANDGAPETVVHKLSENKAQAEGEFQLEETSARYIKLEGDPTHEDGKLKLCLDNPDNRAGLWTRVAYREANPAAGASSSADWYQASPGQNIKTLANSSAVQGDWCTGARQLGSAPAGYALPFGGYMIITNGPGEGLHTGASSQAVDYAPQGGSPWTVRSVAAGTVVDVTTVSDFGTVVRIKHADGNISFYAHLDTNNVYVEGGDQVSPGEGIALTGNSGNGAGYHLHFEARNGWNESSIYSGSPVDVRGTPGTWWCEWYPPGDEAQYSGYADSSGTIPAAVDDAIFIDEGPPEDGTEYLPDDTFTKTWTIANSGSSTWHPGTYHATRISGYYGPPTLALPYEVTPGQQAEINGDFTVPAENGTHRATYQMAGSSGVFGEQFWVEIVVAGVANIAPLPLYEVSLDMQNPDCPGGFAEVDGFGTLVPSVTVVVSYAGDPDAGDLCRGHGPDPVCGRNESNPPCGSAGFRYSAEVTYPQETVAACATQSGANAGSMGLGWMLGLISLTPILAIRRRYCSRPEEQDDQLGF